MCTICCVALSEILSRDGCFRGTICEVDRGTRRTTASSLGFVLDTIFYLAMFAKAYRAFRSLPVTATLSTKIRLLSDCCWCVFSWYMSKVIMAKYHSNEW